MGASGFRGAFFVLREKEEDLTQRARRRSTEGTEKGNGERGRFTAEGAQGQAEGTEKFGQDAMVEILHPQRTRVQDDKGRDSAIAGVRRFIF